MNKEEKVEIINLDNSNIDEEDIVCVRGEKNSDGIIKKKAWLKERFKEGLKFKVLKVDGRSWGFIEYIPAEYAWRPIDAPGYMVIDCIWVIGRHKGKNFGALLLDECIKDAKKTNGIVILTSSKAWMPNKEFFLKKGFEVCDSAPVGDSKPVFELLVKKFKKAPDPKFMDNAKKCTMKDNKKLMFYHTDQCPYIAQHAQSGIECAKIYNLPYEVVKYKKKEEARNSASPYESYSIFFKGKLMTHDLVPKILAKKLDEMLTGAE